MARTATITREMILETAFAMTRDEGFSQVTARKVAAKAGCSTQPVFRVYKNMDELWNAVYESAVDHFHHFYHHYPRSLKTPFCNLGMAYISFAAKEKHLFELLFLTGGRKSLYELLNGKEGNVFFEINRARVSGCPDPKGLFMKMWIFIHGAACMSLTGDYDLAPEETAKLLESTYEEFLTGN
jgi:AcrR family transcriptional regulator